ncbi:MAG: hypothetical protein HXK63_10340 [Campylobacter sp.]|nr:hypothetical protein [Campylobacter sp.]
MLALFWHGYDRCGGKFCPLIGKILIALFFDAQARGSEILPGKGFIRALYRFANGAI